MKRKNRSIILPLLLVVIPTIIIVLSLFTIYFSISLKAQVSEVKTALGSTVISNIEKGFNTWFEDQIILAETFAGEQLLIDSCLNPEDPILYNKAETYIKNFILQNDYYESISVILYDDKDISSGSVFLDTLAPSIIGKGNSSIYSSAIRDGKDFFIGKTTLSDKTRTPVITVAVPIKQNNKLIGAIGLSCDISHVTENYFTQETFGKTEYIFIIDDDGNMVAHPDESLVMTDKGREVLIPFVEKFKNKEYIFEQDYQGSHNLYISKEMTKFSENSANNWVIHYRGSLNELFTELNKIIAFSIIFTLCAVILMVIIMVFLSFRLIQRPLKHIENELATIAKGGGDLTKTIEIKKMDETGRISDAFNHFTITLRTMINKIKASVKTNSKLREELASSTEETSAAITQILSNIQSIQNIIKNLDDQSSNASASTSEISISIDDLNSQAENQSAAVEESTAAVEQMISSLKNMATTTSRNQKTSEKLMKSAEESNLMLDDTYNSIQKVTTNIDSIRDMTEMIDTIASQTNLLAMNAAIEAAHAGDAGKGFAVVADEIRKLAEDSSSSSNQIATEVKIIVDQIQHSNDYSRQLQILMGEMISQIKSVAMAFSEINSSSAEMSAGSDQVLKAMISLSELSLQLSASSDKMKTGTSTVSININSVQELTQTAKAAIEEISYGSNEILTAMSQIQDNVLQLGESTENLSNEVDNFKT